MDTPEIEAHEVHISPFGICTLLSLEVLPAPLRCYEKLQKTAQQLGLQELPENLGEETLPQILMQVARTVGAASIWISGVHDSYHTINLALEESDQQHEPCIVCFELTYLERDIIEISSVRQIPIREIWDLDFEDTCYCLFLGSADA